MWLRPIPTILHANVCYSSVNRVQWIILQHDVTSYMYNSGCGGVLGAPLSQWQQCTIHRANSSRYVNLKILLHSPSNGGVEGAGTLCNTTAL